MSVYTVQQANPTMPFFQYHGTTGRVVGNSNLSSYVNFMYMDTQGNSVETIIPRSLLVKVNDTVENGARNSHVVSQPLSSDPYHWLHGIIGHKMAVDGNPSRVDFFYSGSFGNRRVNIPSDILKPLGKNKESKDECGDNTTRVFSSDIISNALDRSLDADEVINLLTELRTFGLITTTYVQYNVHTGKEMPWLDLPTFSPGILVDTRITWSNRISCITKTTAKASEILKLAKTYPDMRRIRDILWSLERLGFIERSGQSLDTTLTLTEGRHAVTR